MGFFNPVTSIIIFFPLSVDDFLRFMFALGKPTSRMLKVDSLHYTGDGGGGVLLGILGRGVPSGSPNPDHISDQILPFSDLVLTCYFFFSPPKKILKKKKSPDRRLTWSLLRLEKQHKRFLKFHFEFVYTPVVPTKNHTRFQTNWAKSIPIFRPKRSKNRIQQGGAYLLWLVQGNNPPGT